MATPRWSPRRFAGIFAQPDDEHVHLQLDVIAGMLGRHFPQVVAMLRDAEGDLLPSPPSRRALEERSGRP
jgi:hypothetical protein